MVAKGRSITRMKIRNSPSRARVKISTDDRRLSPTRFVNPGLFDISRLGRVADCCSPINYCVSFDTSVGMLPLVFNIEEKESNMLETSKRFLLCYVSNFEAQRKMQFKIYLRATSRFYFNRRRQRRVVAEASAESRDRAQSGATCTRSAAVSENQSFCGSKFVCPRGNRRKTGRVFAGCRPPRGALACPRINPETQAPFAPRGALTITETSSSERNRGIPSKRRDTLRLSRVLRFSR